MSATVSPARLLAFDTLRKVGRGGYASDLLAAAGPLDPRDAALGSEIVFGVLRYQAQLDFLIQHYSGRAVAKLDFEVLLALRMGVYQLRYLDRVPPHAAVGQSVELVKSMGFRSATGFANAVLRKVGREAVAWPDRAVELSLPDWLLERWDREFGAATATLIARANLRPPETYIRIPPNREIPPGITVEPTEIPGCYRLAAGEAGGFRIQDIGSQAVVPLLDLAPGLTFLDLCAAPGNKTAQALEFGVRAVACDFHAKRVEMLRPLGVSVVHLDGTRPLPFGRRFDRILLDAPCSERARSDAIRKSSGVSRPPIFTNFTAARLCCCATRSMFWRRGARSSIPRARWNVRKMRGLSKLWGSLPAASCAGFRAFNPETAFSPL